MSDTEKIVAQILQVAVVQPGDALVVGVTEATSREQLEDVGDHIRAALPETVKVCVLGGAIEMHVLRSGEATA